MTSNVVGDCYTKWKEFLLKISLRIAYSGGVPVTVNKQGQFERVHKAEYEVPTVYSYSKIVAPYDIRQRQEDIDQAAFGVLVITAVWTLVLIMYILLLVLLGVLACLKIYYFITGK